MALVQCNRVIRMREFERVYMRTLRHVYDTEKQLMASLRAIGAQTSDPALATVLAAIEAQSAQQALRIEDIFRLLHLEPRTEASWVTTALLRDAWEACAERGGSVQGCAAALLAIKRYEITLYESLLRWSEQCYLVEPLAEIRRSIAEELVQASVLSELAFEDATRNGLEVTRVEQGVLH